MNTKSRVATLERESGINEPCEVCEASDRFTRAVAELAARFNIALPKPLPHELLTSACLWCLRPVRVNLRGMTEDERAAYKEYFTAQTEGRLCALRASEDKVDFSTEEAARRIFAKCFVEYKQLCRAMVDEINAIARRVSPRFHYLCRVDGCNCRYPKTDEEWQANQKRRGKKAA